MKLRFPCIACFLLLITNLAAQQAPVPPAAPQQIQVSPHVQAVLPPNFAVVPQRSKNLTEVVSRVAGKQSAYVAITTEHRTDHAEAVGRLLAIASEADGKLSFTEICRWPALERVYSKRLAHIQSEGASGEPAKREEKPTPRVAAATIAVAEGDDVVRFEAALQEGADPAGLDEILELRRALRARRIRSRIRRSRRLRCSAAAATQTSGATNTRSHPGHRTGASIATARRIQVRTRCQPQLRSRPFPGANCRLRCSATGQVVVIGSNLGKTSFSNDYGDSFTASSTSSVGVTDGDPVVGTGASGQFYLGGLDLRGTTCADVVGVDTARRPAPSSRSRGMRSLVRSTLPPAFPTSRSWPWTLATPLPLATSSTWYATLLLISAPQKCNLITPSTTLAIGATPTISCSVDSGKTWQNQTAVGSGDRGRITVGIDGFVYVTYVSGGNLEISKFSSCANGLQVQPHFPLKISSFRGVDCPIDGLFTTTQPVQV